MRVIPGRLCGVAAGNQASASGNVGYNVTGQFGAVNLSAKWRYYYYLDNGNPTVQALRSSGNTLTDVFTYTMRDAAGLTSTTQLTVTITGRNDAPQMVYGTATSPVLNC